MERYLTSILLPWPRVSKMLTQPCTNLDWHRAPRRCARSLLQCSPACTQMKSPRTAGKNVGLCHIRAHLASIYIGQKLDPPYREPASAAEKRRFINAPSLTRSFPLGADTCLLRYIKLIALKLLPTRDRRLAISVANTKVRCTSI